MLHGTSKSPDAVHCWSFTSLDSSFLHGQALTTLPSLTLMKPTARSPSPLPECLRGISDAWELAFCLSSTHPAVNIPGSALMQRARKHGWHPVRFLFLKAQDAKDLFNVFSTQTWNQSVSQGGKLSSETRIEAPEVVIAIDLLLLLEPLSEQERETMTEHGLSRSLLHFLICNEEKLFEKYGFYPHSKSRSRLYCFVWMRPRFKEK
ncbi:uncharacterized protein LOC116750941 [Phocoena sinus]|uniref:uncharacterized protein LOC116750941 n=1 Tax=Phocoena sinus TaxID=42100 RepID=UPI0013C429A6|nr:uncharacterized protein LOC116750941 [Phocoena sinus]